MKAKLGYLSVFLLVMGCMVQNSSDYQVIRKYSRYQWASTEYQDHKFLAQEIQKVCDNAFWDSSTCAGELAVLPVGGRMVINVKGYSYDAVNTTNMEYLIQDTSGREIIRQTGYPREAWSVVDKSGMIKWYNVDYMPLPFEIQVPFKFFVIDHSRVIRNEFLMTSRRK